MKVGILKPILFIFIIFILGSFFIQTGQTARLNAFYENEVRDYYETEPKAYANTLLHGIADKVVEDPIYHVTISDLPNYEFDLSIYLYELDGSNLYLYLFSDVRASQGGVSLNSLKLKLALHLDSPDHEATNIFLFSENKESDSVPYFAVRLSDDKKSLITPNQTSNANMEFPEILEMQITLLNNNDLPIGSPVSIKSNQDLSYPSAHTNYNVGDQIEFNGHVDSFNYDNPNFVTANKTLYKSYNSVFINYIIILVAVLLVLGAFMFFNEQIVSFFNKLFNKNKPTVTGKVE